MNAREQRVVKAIKDGTVIDHIPSDRTLLVVEHLTNPTDCFFIGINLSSTSLKRKGIIKIQEKFLSARDLEVLAVLAPDATINEIKDYSIVNKKNMVIPEEVINLFICGNANCITNAEDVVTRFRMESREYQCQYCERMFSVDKLKIKRPMI